VIAAEACYHDVWLSSLSDPNAAILSLNKQSVTVLAELKLVFEGYA
jgi:hypothetical protein